MRRLAAAILAAPVIASIYLAALLAVPGARKYLASLGAVLLASMVGVGFLMPPGVPSTPLSTPRQISADDLRPVETRTGDVAAATAATSGDSAAPAAPGIPGTAAIPTVRANPNPRTAAVSPSVTVRSPATTRIAGSQMTGNRLRLTSAITLGFDRPVTLKQVRAAFAVKPVVTGTLRALTDRVYTFTPTTPLAANTAYVVSLTTTIRDTNGVVIATPRPVRLLTASAPAVVRFRPTKGTAAVDPTQLVSVRFTKAMDVSTTARAFSVVVAGRKVAGSITWAEGDTVLVFKPTKVLAKGAGVGIRVLGTATSADGVQLQKGGSATFTVVAGPMPILTAAKPVTRSGGAKPAHPARVPLPAPKPTATATPAHAANGAAGIEGVDVSHHDGAIDWGQVAAAGKTFAYLKASEGTGYVDPTYATNRASAERAGLRVGAFHYAQPDTSAGEAAAEADHFVDTAAFKSGELLPMLDLEVTNGLSPAELQGWVASFLDRVYQRTGLHTGIYVSPSFWTENLNDTSSFALKGYGALWIAHWTAEPSPSIPASNWGGLGWTIWQYSDRASVAGMSKPADVDHFSGSDLARLIIP